MNPQLEGIESIAGTYVFDLRRSVRAFNLNRFFWRMTQPEFRELFRSDEAAACDAANLVEEERALVRERDWLGLVRYGVNFFALEKFARVLRLSNVEVYATMRGETSEAFLSSCSAPGAR